MFWARRGMADRGVRAATFYTAWTPRPRRELRRRRERVSQLKEFHTPILSDESMKELIVKDTLQKQNWISI
jgi:hypothetical protein